MEVYEHIYVHLPHRIHLLLQAVCQLPVSEVKGDQQRAGVLLVFAYCDLSLQILSYK